MLGRVFVSGIMSLVIVTNALTNFEPVVIPEYDSIELLARCVQAEAGNQGQIGKELVVDVILNRVDSDKFPNTVEGVISQRGQFAVYASGAINKITPDEETYAAVEHEMSNERHSTEILYFKTKSYHKFGEPWGKFGDHYFSKAKEEKN